jgi:[ribosomal protein S5]-alanine N-acetyltransferase
MGLTTGQSPPAQIQIQATLTTQRLWLRPLCTSDTTALHAAFADEETVRYAEFVPSRTLADTTRWVELCLIPIPLWRATWVLAEMPDGPAIGIASYHHREAWNERLEIGFMLARPWWGRGLMQEAMIAVLEYCFDSLSVTRAEVMVDPANQRAIRLVERLGFCYEGGPLRRRLKVGANYRAQMIYGLLREDWPHTYGRLVAGQTARTQQYNGVPRSISPVVRRDLDMVERVHKAGAANP